jgi:hypothetical protein
MSFAQAPQEFALGMSHERGAAPQGTQSQHRVQYEALFASPP